jgi:hypothetical protein
MSLISDLKDLQQKAEEKLQKESLTLSLKKTQEKEASFDNESTLILSKIADKCRQAASSGSKGVLLTYRTNYLIGANSKKIFSFGWSPRSNYDIPTEYPKVLDEQHSYIYEYELGKYFQSKAFERIRSFCKSEGLGMSEVIPKTCGLGRDDESGESWILYDNDISHFGIMFTW